MKPVFDGTFVADTVYDQGGRWEWEVASDAEPGFNVVARGMVLFRNLTRRKAAKAAKLLLEGTVDQVELAPGTPPGRWVWKEDEPCATNTTPN